MSVQPTGSTTSRRVPLTVIKAPEEDIDWRAVANALDAQAPEWDPPTKTVEEDPLDRPAAGSSSTNIGLTLYDKLIYDELRRT